MPISSIERGLPVLCGGALVLGVSTLTQFVSVDGVEFQLALDAVLMFGTAFLFAVGSYYLEFCQSYFDPGKRYKFGVFPALRVMSALVATVLLLTGCIYGYAFLVEAVK